MAKKGYGAWDEVVENQQQQPTRVIEAPPSDELNIPDTSDLPPRKVLDTSEEALDIPKPALGQPKRQDRIPQQSGIPTAPVSQFRPEEAVEASEQMETIRPSSTFDTFIGHNRYYFVKDKPVKVPRSVREILSHAGRIYP